MSDHIPFLFLDSPRVGGIGHAFVLAPDEPTPSEGILVSLSRKARTSQARSSDSISVQYPVLQSDTNRQGTELLICGGAIPDSEAGIEAIREVLDSLWKGEMTEADLYQDKLTKRAALIYDAPCMRRIADRFFADIRVQAVRWIAAEMIPADHVPEPAASEVINSAPIWVRVLTRFRHLSIFIKLIILTLLCAIAIIVSGVAMPKKVVTTQENPVTNAEGSRKEWEFLAEDDWPRILKATGGKSLAVQLSSDDGAKKAETSGHKEVTAKGTHTPDESKMLTEIHKWLDIYTEEFALGAVTPESIKTSDISKYLAHSKATNDKAMVGAWIGNFNDQRDHYRADNIKKAAKTLDDFRSYAGNPPHEDLPRRLRDIWKALEDFSTSTNENQGPFRKRLTAELKKSNKPPIDYDTLTIKDAQRVEIVKTILGSKEFGLVLSGEECPSEVPKWGKINERIKDHLTAVRISAGQEPRDVLLRALDKSFQPTAPP